MSIKNNTTSLQELLEVVNNLPNAGSGGVDLPELDNEGSAEDLMLGKELIDANGNVVSGSFTIDSELTTQDSLISQIVTALEGKSAAGADPVLQSKTITPTTSSQIIEPDSGYDGLDVVTVNAIPSNYIVPSGTLNITTNGTHDVKNYASATVNVTGSSGGTDTSFTDAAMGTLTTIDDDSITSLRQYAFAYITGLKTARLSGVTAMPNSVFRECPNLESVDLSNVTGTLGAYTFMNCSKLKTINVSNAINSSTSLCNGCVELERVEFGNMNTIGTTAFSGCTKLTTLIIRGGRSNGTTPPNLSNANAFNNTPIANGTGFVYVKKSLLSAYQSATNWSTYAAQIRAIEDYPDICGT